jgi:hypothetical protein
MADFVFNIALGKVAEYAARVNANDPANSALVIMAFENNGVTDAALRDLTTFAAIEATAGNEVTNGGYARIVLDDTDGITVNVDNANDRQEVDIPDQVFTAILAGDTWDRIIVGYDSDTTGGTDANIVPLVSLDAGGVVPNGGNINLSINAAGIFRAQG